MRAHEFIKEVLDISAPAPATTWHSDVDPWGNKVAVGQWKDETGKTVQNWFEKNPKGDVKVTFDRGDEYKVTGTGQGKQSSIMTGAVKNVTDYIQNNQDANQLKFSSSDASRTRLYNRIVDRLAPQMGMVGTATYDPNLQRTNYSLRKAQPGETHTPIATPRMKSGGGSGGRGGMSGHLSDPSAVKSLIPNFESKLGEMGAELDPKAMMQRNK